MGPGDGGDGGGGPTDEPTGNGGIVPRSVALNPLELAAADTSSSSEKV